MERQYALKAAARVIRTSATAAGPKKVYAGEIPMMDIVSKLLVKLFSGKKLSRERRLGITHVRLGGFIFPSSIRVWTKSRHSVLFQSKSVSGINHVVSLRASRKTAEAHGLRQGVQTGTENRTELSLAPQVKRFGFPRNNIAKKNANPASTPPTVASGSVVPRVVDGGLQC